MEPQRVLHGHKLLAVVADRHIRPHNLGACRGEGPGRAAVRWIRQFTHESGGAYGNPPRTADADGARA